MFRFHADVEALTVGEGVNRKILNYTDEVMICEFTLEKGAVIPAHSHPHVQVTYVVSGKIQYNRDGEVEELSAGDSVIATADVPHDVVALEASRVVDVFTPMREDFVAK